MDLANVTNQSTRLMFHTNVLIGRYTQSQVPAAQQHPTGGSTPAAAAIEPEVTVAQWQKKHALDPVAFFNGRVGINTDNPHEALTVNGNVLVTGKLKIIII